jgi:hypothetical protein
MQYRDWAMLVLIPLLSAGLYVPLVRRTAPDDSRDLADRLQGLLRRRGSA